mmetsp:Transcript_4455/g.9728  ORF Transcript_4455/g.9728 Transcript_4455/m.9728 type:complete len:249 (-) Transcript_4455:710-1456(-)
MSNACVCNCTDTDDEKFAEYAGLVLSFTQAASTAAVAAVGAIWSRRQRLAEQREATRIIIREACDGVNLPFAMEFFRNRGYVDPKGTQHPLSEADFQQVLSAKVRHPREPRHRACRSELLVFLESLRPCAHVLGASADAVLIGAFDPIASRLRLALSALAHFWSPSDGTFSPCTDEYREFLRSSYGGPEEWRLLCQTASRLGLAGRFTGPWDTAIAVDSTGSSLGAGAAPNISKAVKAVPDAAKVALL